MKIEGTTIKINEITIQVDQIIIIIIRRRIEENCNRNQSIAITQILRTLSEC